MDFTLNSKGSMEDKRGPIMSIIPSPQANSDETTVRSDCPALPKGWKREEIIRKSGLSAGKIDVVYYSPSGKKFQSKPQLARYLGDTIDLTSFDFRTGKINSLLLRKSKRQRGPFDYSSRGGRADSTLVPPIRQTASIFKQPVTIVKTQESKIKTDFKHGPQEKPKQLFWEKRLQGLHACNMDEEELLHLQLPGNLRPVGPNVKEDTLLQSIATALHVSNQPIMGQTGNKLALEKNPGVYINPEQPLVQAVVITDEDILSQEEKVNKSRKQLEEALLSISMSCMIKRSSDSCEAIPVSPVS